MDDDDYMYNENMNRKSGKSCKAAEELRSTPRRSYLELRRSRGWRSVCNDRRGNTRTGPSTEEQRSIVSPGPWGHRQEHRLSTD